MARKRFLRGLLAAALGLSVTLSASPPALAAGDAASLPEVTPQDRLYKVSRLKHEEKYEQALALAESTRVMLEQQGSTKSRLMVEALNDIAVFQRYKGDYAEAQRGFEHAIRLLEELDGLVSIELLREHMNLGRVLQEQGDDLRAEALLLRSVEMARELWKVQRNDGNVHQIPYPADPLRALADLYLERGDYARAEALLLESQRLVEEVAGGTTFFAVAPLIRLGTFYRRRGDLARARPLLESARAIIDERSDATQPLHAELAEVIYELGLLAVAEGDDRRAEPLLTQALELRTRLEGQASAATAACADALGALLSHRGDDGRAEPLLTQALATQEKALGPESPRVAKTLHHIADLRLGRGDLAGALKARRRAAQIQDRHAALMLTGGSEQQKRIYMATLQADTDRTVSMHAVSAPLSADAAELALTVILRRKGRVLDAMADGMAALRRRLLPADQALLDRLAAVNAALGAQVLRGAGDVPAEQHRRNIEKQSQQRDDLEAQVSQRSSAFRAHEGLPTTADLRSALPDDAALLELFRVRPALPGAAAKRWGAPRYVAYLLRRSGPLRFADLGPADAINAAVTRFRRALAHPAVDPKPAARALDALVMQPVRPLLGATRRILLSPDGQLNLVPFGSLIDEQGRYLLEDLSFTYLTSGRDLLRFGQSAAAQRGPMVVADPAFGPVDAASGAGDGKRGARSVDLSRVHFPPLPGTAAEGRAIGEAIAGVDLRMGSAATEAAVKAARAPRILHIATHGFFLPDDQESGPSPGPDAELLSLPRENPLLRSGLALSGANPRVSDGDNDGVLTALEASALDLDGTKLIVLSACETALGEATNGEGVFGLRRALVIAGAETQVMSLWRVDDEATRALMIAYYERLRRGEGRGEALRQVELEMLARRRTAHPHYWASFIVSGADAALDSANAFARVSPGPRGCSCEAGGDPGGGLPLMLALGVAGVALRRRGRVC